jgi:hypothetical protein
MISRLLAGLLLFSSLTAPAFADDWLVAKLRGTAEVFVENDWVPLNRGDVISDDRQVRTLAESRLELHHGKDILSLDPETVVSIDDFVEESVAKTIIRQASGTVEVEAETRQVNHLTVETEFLAAVVKGTRFVVIVGPTGAAVEVSEGLVAVKATETEYSTSVAAGNTAFVEPKGALWVTGTAPMPKLYDGKGAEMPMPIMPKSAGVKRHASPISFDAADAAPIRVAEASPSAGIGLPLQLAQSGGSNSAPVATSGGGLDLATAGIGVAIGIMIGSVGLLFRRFLR